MIRRVKLRSFSSSFDDLSSSTLIKPFEIPHIIGVSTRATGRPKLISYRQQQIDRTFFRRSCDDPNNLKKFIYYDELFWNEFVQYV